MHWTLPDVWALPRDAYDVVLDELIELRKNLPR